VAVTDAFIGSTPAFDAADRVVEQLRIPAAFGVVLAATLHVPLGHDGGPFPVVVAIPGGGPGGRCTYNHLKERMLGDGIAMLEYDKRGFWESTGEQTESLRVQEEDAAAVTAFLRTRPDLDCRRIGLLGLCQGGIVAPALATREAGIAAVVMLSAPVGPARDTMLGQMAYYLRTGGMSEPAIARLTSATAELLDARTDGCRVEDVNWLRGAVIDAFVAAGFSPAEAEGALNATDTPDMLANWTSMSLQSLQNVRAPVLAVYASLDGFVPPSTCIPAARAALAGNADSTVVELPGLNHVFQPGGTGSLDEIKELGEVNRAPELIELVGNWLDARLNAGRIVRLAKRA